jgi:uncharacterized protein (DUF1697 family)
MHTYISILRGINVSGQKKIIMADLVKLYEDLGFTDVKTYIQSGNVVFNSTKKVSNSMLVKQIETKINEIYGFLVPVIIRTVDDLSKIIASNPFKNETSENLYITFLSNLPNSNHLENLTELNYLLDEFIVIEKEIYLNVSSYGTTKLSNSFFENKLKVTATTRNWNTVNKLLAISTE